MPSPRRGKAKVKVTSSGRRVSYGQAGKAKDGGPRVRPGTSKGDSYCARSLGIRNVFLKRSRMTLTHPITYHVSVGSVRVLSP